MLRNQNQYNMLILQRFYSVPGLAYSSICPNAQYFYFYPSLL